jgi:hypothetical protein
MADWTTPVTRSVGDILTAANWNTYVRDNTPWFDFKVTTTTVVTTVAETDLFNAEIVIPAGQMGSNQRLDGWASIDLKNNTGGPLNTPRFKLKLDGTVLLDTGTAGGTPMAANAVRGSGQIYFTIQQQNSTSVQEVTLWGSIVDGAKVTFTTGSGVYAVPGSAAGLTFFGRAAAAVNMTSARTLSLTVINPSALGTYETALYAARIAIGV